MIAWRDIREYVAAKVSAIVRASRVSLSTASGNGDKVDGHLTYEDEAPGGYDYTVRRLWPFGIRSRPPVGCDAVVVHAFGGSTNGVMVGAESSSYGPSDLAEGEVAIYAKKAGAVIKIDVDGKITINSAAGVNVVVNGGAKTVAVNNDFVSPTAAFTTWTDAVTAATGVPALAPGNIGQVTATGTRFKA